MEREPRGSAATAFAVLEAVAAGQPIGVSALAGRLGLPKSSVQRALQTLDELRYLTRTPDARWRLTPRVLALASSVTTELTDVADEELHRIVSQSGESAHLTVLDGRFVVGVLSVECSQTVRAHAEYPGRLAAHASATGKALLAMSDLEAVDAYLAKPLETYTEHTLPDPAAVRDALTRIRTQGWAVNDRESAPDVAAVGAVARGPDGSVLAGIGVHGPHHRFGPAAWEVVAPAVVEAASRVSAAMSGLRPYSARSTTR